MNAVRCDLCHHWWAAVKAEIGDDDQNDYGYCHRHAPRPSEVPEESVGRVSLCVVWPITRGDDLCGDFRPAVSHPETPA